MYIKTLIYFRNRVLRELYNEDQLTVYKEVLLYSELDDTNCQLVFVTTLLNTEEDALLGKWLISSSLVQYKHDILLVSD